MPVPLAQIFHISDLHIGSPKRPSPAWRWVLRQTPFFGPSILQGLAGHDVSALRAFEESAKRVLAVSPEWQDKTWIVSTGDLSTWGDSAGVDAGIGHLEGISQRCGNLPCVTLYGNHDVWDNSFPLFRSQPTLHIRRTRLRSSSPHFSTDWPVAPASCPNTGRHLEISVPGTRTQIVFCSLNTVLHERLENSAALGEVKQDRYWEDLTNPLPEQVARLSVSCAGTDQIRVILTHHPIHHPAPPHVGMVLQNRDAVAQRLAVQVHGSPLGAVIISGHTHSLFPDIGQVPTQTRRPPPEWHLPLEDGQVQLIGGTLSQRSWNGLNQEQAWQVLRFWQDPPGSRQVVLERIVLKRSSGTGAFRPIGGPGGLAERISL